MKKKRPSLREALSAESRIGHADDDFETGGAAQEAGTRAGRARVGVRLSPAMRRELRIVAIRRRTTVQDLLLAAIVQVLREPDTPPSKA